MSAKKNSTINNNPCTLGHPQWLVLHLF